MRKNKVVYQIVVRLREEVGSIRNATVSPVYESKEDAKYDLENSKCYKHIQGELSILASRLIEKRKLT